MEEIKYCLWKLLISKDYVYDSKELACFKDYPSAKEALDKNSDSGTWQEHDYHEIHVFRNGKDLGSLALLEVMCNEKFPKKNNSAYLNCNLCSGLKDIEFAEQKFGSYYPDIHLPDTAEKLTLIRNFNGHSDRQLQLKQCPECKTYYLFESDYEYFAGGSEDEQKLSRLNDIEAAIYRSKLVKEE